MHIYFKQVLFFLFCNILSRSALAAENCANVLSNGGYLFASWAAVPLEPESQIGTFWDTHMNGLCRQIECPIFCSENNGKVPAYLVDLQKKCREKNTAACDSFFETLKIKNKEPFEFCFYVGGKACDFCDRFGGEYCKPEMRFGGLKQDYQALIIHKIACKAGFDDACRVLKKRSQETTNENLKKCDDSINEDSCRLVVNQLIDLGKNNEALEKSIQVCRKSQYQVCKTFVPSGHKDMPSAHIEKFSKVFHEALKVECQKTKIADPCFIYAEYIKKSQPEIAMKYHRQICKEAKLNNLSEVAGESCRTNFRNSMDNKNYAEAKIVLKKACQGLRAAQMKNGVTPTECFYEKELKDIRTRK